MTRPAIDLTGRTFGRLLVLRRADPPYHRIRHHAAWLCRCVCGAEPRIMGVSLTRGATRSCGCLHAAVARERALARPMTKGPDGKFRAEVL